MEKERYVYTTLYSIQYWYTVPFNIGVVVTVWNTVDIQSTYSRNTVENFGKLLTVTYYVLFFYCTVYTSSHLVG